MPPPLVPCSPADMTDQPAEPPSPSLPQRGELTSGGWTIWRYRGAEIHTQGRRVALHLPGHPYHGRSGFDFDMVLKMVDAWRDSPARQPLLTWPPNASR